MILIKPSFEVLDYPKTLLPLANYLRTCYKSESFTHSEEEDHALIARCIHQGHESVLEHEKITVKIICDRGVSHELVRHRIASFSQESTRYCNYSKDRFGGHVTFVLPPWVSIEPGLYDYHFVTDEKSDTLSAEDYIWIAAMNEDEQHYLTLIDNGWQPQQARAVLPNSLKTEIIITANLREWRHIFKLRAEGSTGKPHPQMLEIMCPLLKEFKHLIPIIFDDIKEMRV
jgi:thymidylate synthase (FAD)